jgi:hypothetical protein
VRRFQFALYRLFLRPTLLVGRAQAMLARDYRTSGAGLRFLIIWSWLPLRLGFLAGMRLCAMLVEPVTEQRASAGR